MWICLCVRARTPHRTELLVSKPIPLCRHTCIPCGAIWRRCVCVLLHYTSVTGPQGLHHCHSMLAEDETDGQKWQLPLAVPAPAEMFVLSLPQGQNTLTSVHHAEAGCIQLPTEKASTEFSKFQNFITAQIYWSLTIHKFATKPIPLFLILKA